MNKTASAVWKGALKDGKGAISTESGVLSNAPYGFNARFENGPGTNPEELIGAAHAGCFTMALSLILGEAKLTDKIKTIGLYRSKSRNLITLSRKLIDEFDGKVPGTREALVSLPGVGRKTANVVLNVAFGEPTIAVDTHLFRVANRTGLAPGKTPLEVELTLDRVVPERYKRNCHRWLILHGRYVCKARKPECWRCLINDICLYEPKTPAPAPS